MRTAFGITLGLTLLGLSASPVRAERLWTEKTAEEGKRDAVVLPSMAPMIKRASVAVVNIMTNGKQPADGPSGTVHERGAYAYYITDKDPSVALVLSVAKPEAGKSKVELKQWPVGILAVGSMQSFFGSISAASGSLAAERTAVGRMDRLNAACALRFARAALTLTESVSVPPDWARS